jgi:surface polysaccharide O-acyltransferase-like enzyme
VFGLAALGLGYAEMLFTKGTHSYLGYLQKSVLILFVFSVFVLLGRRPERWLAAVATSSFGLFFVHSYAITAGKMGLQRVLGHQPPGTLWGVLLAAAMASVVSYAIVQLLRRVLRSHSRHVIGV